jgi:hypothetical protein
MIKIKKSNFILTSAAIAALVFLLPPDKEAPKTNYHESQAASSMQGNTTKTHQQQPSVRGNFLHSV